VGLVVSVVTTRAEVHRRRGRGGENAETTDPYLPVSGAFAEVVPLRVQVDDHIGFGRDGPVTGKTSHTAAQRIAQHHDRAVLNRRPHIEGEGVAVDDQRRLGAMDAVVGSPPAKLDT
jgi:hypothetical protein